mmetsp:Transcript_147733/g.260466  ORF Transcript_147733/g.260466 Transcript_147733/m.260466 type:complete len:106 (-) Transcript_147733:227-544(-)
MLGSRLSAFVELSTAALARDGLDAVLSTSILQDCTSDEDGKPSVKEVLRGERKSSSSGHELIELVRGGSNGVVQEEPERSLLVNSLKVCVGGSGKLSSRRIPVPR